MRRPPHSVGRFLRAAIRAVLLIPFVQFAFLGGHAWCGAEPGTNQESAPCAITFGKERVDASCGPVVLKRQGGRPVVDGMAGSALRLGKGEFLVLDAGKLVNPKSGSVAFWVRPQWEPGDRSSHTFLSFPWLDGRNGYFTLSRGWWEPQGASLTYLIGNNQEYANVARRIRFDHGVWTHFVCVWQAGNPGFIRLYLNGMPAGESRLFTGAYPAKGELYLGADLGTPLAGSRWADADFAGLSFYRRTLAETEILNLYRQQNASAKQLSALAGEKFPGMRAIFDEGVGWQTESGARETIRRIKRAGFTVYIPCVWHGGGAQYPSTVAPLKSGKRFGSRDPLARLIAISHENGIEVHPWFMVTLREREFLRDHYGPGTPGHAFDLHRPAFRRFMIDQVVDVARRYPIDGVNLDYIRTMGLCRCDACVTGYRQRYSRDLLDDEAHPNIDGTLEPHLQEWQDQAVEEVVREIAHQVRELRPACRISVDGFPQEYPSPEGRQEARWANAGLVDLVFNMDYAQPPDVERHHLVAAGFRDPDKLAMLISNHDWIRGKVVPKRTEQLCRTVEYLRSRWRNGIGIYLYSMLNDAQVEGLRNGPFSEESP